MDPVTEGLTGLDALAKLVVCTIGLFCIPLLTRKYTQNLGLSAGQTIMSKAFYAAQLAGVPQIGMALKQATRNFASQSKEVLSSGSKQALIGGEKFMKRLTHPSMPLSHPKLQSQLEEQAIKNKMMRERGILPWTQKDEKKLATSTNPQEIKALSQRRHESTQFQSAWSEMKSLQQVHSQAQAKATIESGTRLTETRAPALSQLASANTTPRSLQAQSSQLQRPQQKARTMERSPHANTTKLERSVEPSARIETRNFAGATRSEPRSVISHKPSASDLYARYQQIRNQKPSWRRHKENHS